MGRVGFYRVAALSYALTAALGKLLTYENRAFRRCPYHGVILSIQEKVEPFVGRVAGVSRRPV